MSWIQRIGHKAEAVEEAWITLNLEQEAGDYGVAMIFFSAGPAHAYAQPEAAGDDPGTRGAGPAVLTGCAGLPGDSERKSAEQYAGDYTVLYPPPGKDRARSGF